jgi:pyruvate/2-oxoglutarate dehydrogenase complex dihydrolipoamide dehydrogenase (E3) component
MPAGRYNLVAIGGGTAGITAALGTAGLGGRSALVERHLLGGDCLNFGSVPSKALIRSGRSAYESGIAEHFGGPALDRPPSEFPSVMRRVRQLRAQMSQHDSAQRLASLGVDVYLGDATFTGPDTLQVAGQTLAFRRAVIATGTRPAEPDVAGLAQLGYLTNETVFSLTELPRRLIVTGAGPIGCELAQALRRLGSEVHLVNRRDRLLGKEDPAAAAVVRSQFAAEGIHLHLGWASERAEATGAAKSLIIARGDERQKLIADEILVAVGRRPNIEGLCLEAAGVGYNQQGVVVNDRLQTTNRRIFAAGDVCSPLKFTHAADAMARLVIRNALLFGRKKSSQLVIPRCTYTDPELAHVGLTPAEADERQIAIDSYRVDLSDVDRAILDGQTAGFAVVHIRRGSGKIVGATIVAAHAGEMIGEITLLMTNKLPLGALGRTIHCYPTQVEVLKRIADKYQHSRPSPCVARVLKRWLAWRR